MKSTSVSVVIVSYNTKDMLLRTIKSIPQNNLIKKIYVSDNGSTDGSIEAVKSLKKTDARVELIENNANLGFSKANNVSKNLINTPYVLFLNPDTEVRFDPITPLIQYMESNPEVMATTCKVVLPGGQLDKDTRRSFPTPIVSLMHFSMLDRLFPKSNLFAKYWYGYLDENKDHEVEVIQGAFLLTRKDVLDKVGWFDEDYFLDGEDIDLCWKISKLGGKLLYMPSKGSVIHYKKGSKSKNKSVKSIYSGVIAMKLFYKKRLSSLYPWYVNRLVYFGIHLLVAARLLKFKLGL